MLLRHHHHPHLILILILILIRPLFYSHGIIEHRSFQPTSSYIQPHSRATAISNPPKPHFADAASSSASSSRSSSLSTGKLSNTSTSRPNSTLASTDKSNASSAAEPSSTSASSSGESSAAGAKAPVPVFLHVLDVGRSDTALLDKLNNMGMGSWNGHNPWAPAPPSYPSCPSQPGGSQQPAAAAGGGGGGSGHNHPWYNPSPMGVSNTNPDDGQNNCVWVSLARFQNRRTVNQLWEAHFRGSLPDREITPHGALGITTRLNLAYTQKVYDSNSQASAYQQMLAG
ncbi:hypothetical protein B0T26DRAFT_780925 [Lasiosphaeria miniovina]|uniref:Uncharacterized protein n=1 Tax=Lasiosphaeria miniovina TaxID=1954250 RepID=A0AA40DR04_9PEZI|nr:uncharacterized protein B0T26DRAFT_780925 [Lasiosphaeria miniovina]KAK0712939.1 hypothetical protein B0T26DRAFT_780925 [Lasiosphaeria miniovina]